MDEVTSTKGVSVIWSESDKGKTKLTGVKFWGNSVKHVNIHVGMDSPVGARVIASGDENRVPLSYREADQVHRSLLNIRTVDFDHTHVMSVDPEEEHCKRRSVDHARAVGFSWPEWKGGILV